MGAVRTYLLFTEIVNEWVISSSKNTTNKTKTHQAKRNEGLKRLLLC